MPSEKIMYNRVMSSIKRNLRSRIVFLNVLILFIMLIIIAGVAITYILQSHRKNTLEQLDLMGYNISYSVQQHINTMSEVSLQIAFNTTVIDFMKQIELQDRKSNIFSRNITDRTKFSKLFLSYLIKDNSVQRIIVFNDYSDYIYAGNVVAYDYNKIPLYDYSRKYAEVFSQRRPFYKELQEYDLLNPVDNNSYFVFTRPILEYASTQQTPSGYVQLFMPIRMLCATIDTLPTNTTAYIIDNTTNNVIYKNGSEIDPFLYTLPNNTTKKIQDTYIHKSNMANTNFAVIIVQEDSYILTLTLLIFSIASTVIFFIIFLAYRLQSNVIKKVLSPLTQLSQKLHDQQLNITKEVIQLEKDDDDELHKVTTAVNAILHQLYNSFDELLIAQRNEFNSYIFALHSQMDPHFIHNTLSVISSLSYEKNYKKIEEICQKLSSIIRYNSSAKETNTSTIKQELLAGQNYLELMKIRYEENLTWKIVDTESYKDTKVPKFIVQPLIENAFMHGLKHIEFPWCITIEVLSNNRKWQISVTDNGCGIDNGALQKINQNLEDVRNKVLKDILHDLEIGGLALTNIYARLYTKYGDNTIFALENHAERFTITVGGYYDNQKMTPTAIMP